MIDEEQAYELLLLNYPPGGWDWIQTNEQRFSIAVVIRARLGELSEYRQTLQA